MLYNWYSICYIFGELLFVYTNYRKKYLIPIFILMLLAANIIPLFAEKNISGLRLRFCSHGALCLNIFLISTMLSITYHIIIAFYLLPKNWVTWVLSAVISILAEAVIFWNGIIRVYFSSIQLGIKHRAIGILCGFIPIINLIVLKGIIHTVSQEVKFQKNKMLLNFSRKEEQICRTKYPILLVHGVFFRDFKYLNYWVRIPEELHKNGGEIYYGNHHSAASIENSAAELTERIKKIVQETGCGKVNIIDHCKGGLDCRYAISRCGAGEYIASITTVNTPHNGCEFADYLLKKLPNSAVQQVASTYNTAMKKLGDSEPDFISAVYDLTSSRCEELNKTMPLPEGVYCQSVGSKLNRALNGKLPLNFTYPLVKYFDGPNDGLVSEKSFPWGENYTFFTVKGKRGISHVDMIDLNRENIPDFDVREVYVQLIADLKNRGF